MPLSFPKRPPFTGNCSSPIIAFSSLNINWLFGSLSFSLLSSNFFSSLLSDKLPFLFFEIICPSSLKRSSPSNNFVIFLFFFFLFLGNLYPFLFSSSLKLLLLKLWSYISSEVGKYLLCSIFFMGYNAFLKYSIFWNCSNSFGYFK